MSKRIPWSKSLRTPLGGATIALVVLLIALAGVHHHFLAMCHGFGRRQGLADLWRGYQILVLADRVIERTGPEREQARRDLEEASRAARERFVTLRQGDATLGIPAA